MSHSTVTIRYNLQIITWLLGKDLSQKKKKEQLLKRTGEIERGVETFKEKSNMKLKTIGIAVTSINSTQ